MTEAPLPPNGPQPPDSELELHPDDWGAITDYVLTREHMSPSALLEASQNEDTIYAFGIPELSESDAEAIFEELQRRGIVDIDFTKKWGYLVRQPEVRQAVEDQGRMRRFVGKVAHKGYESAGGQYVGLWGNRLGTVTGTNAIRRKVSNKKEATRNEQLKRNRREAWEDERTSQVSVTPDAPLRPLGSPKDPESAPGRAERKGKRGERRPSPEAVAELLKHKAITPEQAQAMLFGEVTDAPTARPTQEAARPTASEHGRENPSAESIFTGPVVEDLWMSIERSLDESGVPEAERDDARLRLRQQVFAGMEEKDAVWLQVGFDRLDREAGHDKDAPEAEKPTTAKSPSPADMPNKTSSAKPKAPAPEQPKPEPQSSKWGERLEAARTEAKGTGRVEMNDEIYSRMKSIIDKVSARVAEETESRQGNLTTEDKANIVDQARKTAANKIALEQLGMTKDDKRTPKFYNHRQNLLAEFDSFAEELRAQAQRAQEAAQAVADNAARTAIDS